MKLTNQLPCCTLLSIFLPLLQLVDDLIKLAVAADSPPLVPHAAWSIRPGLASVGYNQLDIFFIGFFFFSRACC
jgi:hypothetical protein